MLCSSLPSSNIMNQKPSGLKCPFESNEESDEHGAVRRVCMDRTVQASAARLYSARYVVRRGARIVTLERKGRHLRTVKRTLLLALFLFCVVKSLTQPGTQLVYAPQSANKSDVLVKLELLLGLDRPSGRLHVTCTLRYRRAVFSNLSQSFARLKNHKNRFHKS